MVRENHIYENNEKKKKITPRTFNFNQLQIFQVYVSERETKTEIETEDQAPKSHHKHS